MSVVRRCLGCSATYLANAHACPKCDSHAGQVEETVAKPKPPRPRKT